MIKDLIQLLKHANGETEAIQIAQGKYKLSVTFKDGINELKRELKWHSI